MLRGFFILFFFLTGALAGVASPLAVELKAFAVTEAPGSEAQFAEVEEVRPGQLLEYRATFANTSDNMLRGVSPEVPVPQGMTVVLDSIDPKQYTVSADGRQFAALPLLDAAGQPLGPEHIRAVRWAAADLPVKGVITVRLRAKVNE